MSRRSVVLDEQPDESACSQLREDLQSLQSLLSNRSKLAMPTSGDASSHGRGMPRAAVTVEVIQGLLNKQYTLKEIAARFKCSVDTIRSRRKETGDSYRHYLATDHLDIWSSVVTYTGSCQHTFQNKKLVSATSCIAR
ncbi:hypothetical protein WJX79_007397 [Trebouxia sp. C0005]